MIDMLAKGQKIFSVILAIGICLFSTTAIADDGEIWVEGKPGAPIIEIKLPSFAPVIEKLGKAVVNISIEGQEKIKGYIARPRQGYPQTPFDYLFEAPQEHEFKRPFQSLGSGFVIHPDGYIVTNNHVIDKATKIIVSFRDDKRTYEAKVIGRDSKVDIALLKVDAGRKLESVVFGNSDNLNPGDWVIAIGNPFRLGHTATVGIVSAKSRKVPGGGPYDDYIQTDASINPGNSGGPLFNAEGEVVGINTAIFSPGNAENTGFNIGIGFAIPINMVKGIVTQLYKFGKVTRGWLGVLIQPVTPDVAEALGIKETSGALIADVVKDGPAAKAGLRRGDIISTYNGKAIGDNDELPIVVANTKIGTKVPVIVIRDGEEIKLKVTIEELTEGQTSPKVVTPKEDELGLLLQEMSKEIAESLGLASVNGILVADVTPNSPAHEAGLERGDVILEANSKPVVSVETFRNLVKETGKNKPILLLVRRGNGTIFLTLKKG